VGLFGARRESLTLYADTQPYEKLLEDCIANNVDQIKRDLPKLMEQHPVSSPLQPLAVLAARKGHAEILQFCLDKGAVFDWNLERSICFGGDSPAMNKILFAEKEKLSGGTSAKSDSRWDPQLLGKWYGDIKW
jgi:hypothetical protein